MVGVHGFQYKGSIQLIRKSHRSATHVFNVAQRVKSDDAVGGKKWQFRAKRGTGNSVISDIESILGSTRSATDRQVGDHLEAFIDASDKLLNRYHALAMVRLAAKYRFDLTSAIPLVK